MEYNHILVRFGELTTKGKNRKVFINKLYQNTKMQLKNFKNLTFEKEYDRMYILLNGHDYQEVCKRLKTVFGIHSFSLAAKVPTEMEAICTAALHIAKSSAAKTFKIESKRNFKEFPLQSMDINRAVASIILKNIEINVDVHNPELRIKIEIRKEFSYIMNDLIYGAGGYPVGVGGRALVMLSGGIDSPVASYLTLKRGIAIDFIHFASPPYTSPKARQKVIDLATKISEYAGPIRLHIIPFTDLQLEIYKHSDESYAMTVMRRMMYRIAGRVAQNYNCLALANGESIGQVASQTLDSMNVIHRVVSLPIIQPVACMDKLEIIELARKIDTYDLSILPFEDCCTIFTPKNPATKPNLERTVSYETNFDYIKYIDECVGNDEVVWCDYSKASDLDIF